MKFFARTEPWADSVDVVAVQDGDGGIRRFVRVTLEVADEIKPGNICAPSITLCRADADMLFNALWDAGLRPHGGYGGTAQVEALKYHLEDMRKLVFVTEAKP